MQQGNNAATKATPPNVARHDSMSGMQAWIGPNLIFVSLLPYFVAIGLQDTHFKVDMNAFMS